MDDLPASGRRAATREELQQQIGAAQVLEVVRPQPGELRIVDLDRSTDVAFGFSLEDARIIALDVDIIIAFTDGGKLLLPNLGLLATGAVPPNIRFAGRPVSWERVFSTITEVSIGEATATLTNIGRSSEAGKEEGTPEPKTEVVATPQAPQPAPLVRLQSTNAADLGIQADVMSDLKSVRSLALDIPKHATLGAGSNTRFSDPNDNIGPGYYLVAGLQVALSVDLFNVSKPRDYKQNSDGSRDIYYAPGGLGSDLSPTYFAQSNARLPGIGSTDKNDVLYLDDPSLVPAGKAYRKVVLTLDSQTNGFEVTNVSLSGFPEGVSLVGYPLVAGRYVIPVDFESGGRVEFGMLYTLPGPTSSKDPNGFYNYFQLNLTTTAANTKGDYRDLDNTLRFGVREVSGPADMEYANLSGKVNVLWSNPPGAEADGGAGDDTIYSSSGADTITGGTGSDLVSYANVAGPVTVNLALRSQVYAQYDVFTDDIERLTGSAFSDSLLGNSSANIIKTGGGADTVDGDGGIDTADFSSSIAGISVDLASTAAQTGGAAAGVVLRNIENIIGSATGANSLSGTSGDNYLEGGNLNDTFVGTGGSDTFIGGGGVNVVDYSTLTQAVSIDMTSSVVLLQDIAKVIGSNFGDTFAGDANNNLIVGGIGHDSVVGRGGSDTVLGHAGDDTFRDASGHDSYSGGTGNDLFLSGSAYQPGSVYDGDEGFDTIDFSAFNPGGGKLTLTLFEDGTGRFAWDGTAATGEFRDMEALIGSQFVDNVLEGNDNVNNLVGGKTSDTLAGNAGADTVSGGDGNDSLMGGGDAGDTVDYGTATAGLDVTMTPGTYTAHVGTDEADTLSGFVNILGSGFDDRISGDSQSSFLSGAAGNDTISPGLGNDTVDGGGGQDVLDLAYLESQPVSLALSSSFALSPTGQSLLALNMEGVRGASGDDTFQADAQHAGYISGEAGNDLLIATGSGGGATFEGGAGSDTLDYSQVAQTVSVNLSATSAAILSVGGVTDVVLGIETFLAGSLNDTIAAIDDSVAHRFLGNAGDDSLAGGTAGDSLVGGIGNDTLAGGAGDDLLDAGDGADSVFGGVGADTLLDTLGNDSLDGGDGATDEISYADRTSGISVAFSTASDATLVVSASETDQIVNIENITGSAGSDTIWAAGDTVAHRFSGLDGSDSLAGGQGADTLIGGAGNDTLVAGDSANSLDGGDGDDSLVGGATADTLIAGAGADTLRAGSGNESVDGGAGVDTLDYSGTSAGLTVAFSGAGAGAVSVTASGKSDTFANIEIFIGSAGDDSVVGSTEADTILGSAGADTVLAGLGNDSLDGGAGGGDLVSYAGTALAISVDFTSANVASVRIAGGEVDTIVNFENFIAGSGNDTVSAAGDTAAHSFSGDAGDDSLIGGLGNDRFDGGDGLADVVSYEARSEAISLAFAPGATVTVNVGTSEVDTILNIENVIGGSGADTLSAIGDTTSHTLTGNAGDDSLAGGSGADMVLGGTGADTFAASDGNDTMDGGDGVDRLSFAGQLGPVRLVAEGAGLIRATLFAADGVTTVGVQDLRNFEAIIGTGLNDTLVGFSDANTLDGGAGQDFILGSGAGDVLFGRAGDDTIVATGVGDTVEGGAGSDCLSGDLNDVLTYVSGTGVSIDVQAGRALETAGTTDTVSGFDYVVGSSTASNTLLGDDDANTLVGGAANDYFVGRLGNDSFVGGGGSDTLDYGTRTLGIVASLGATGSIVLSGTETDRFAGITQFTFSSGDDSIVSGATADSVFGAAGNDSFIASSGGADTVDAGSGSDVLSYADSAFSSVTATLTGAGLASATVSLAAGGVRQDRIANFEVVIGSSGNDSFLGDAANNQTFIGTGGNDTFDGGAGGLDFVDYSGTPGVTSIFVDMLGATPSAVLYGAGGAVLKVDRLSNIEGIRVGGSGNSTLFGDTSGNVLIGGDGADLLVGRDGNDTIWGGLGNDSMFGNTSGAVADAGDVLDYSYTNNVSTAVTGLTYDMAGATAGVLVSVGLGDIDLVGRFRNVIGSRGDDSIVTDTLTNTVDLGAGNDTVTGGEAGDSFKGGAGSDILDYSSAIGDISVTLAGVAAITVTVAGSASGIAAEFEGFIGGAGNDLLAGDEGANIIAGGAGADTLNLNGGDDSAFGGTGNDSVLGGAGNDTLAGGDGTDTVLGGAGNDCISGGLGNDTLDGGAGNDALFYGDAQAGITVALTGTTVATTVTVGSERDIVANFEMFVGSAFADSIVGSAANETILGGAGDDTFIAAGGSNSVAGGAGNDLVFVDTGAGNDTFDGGEGVDTIDFSQFTTGVSVILGASGVASTAYVGGRTITLVNFENITGGSGADTLVGNELGNVLIGGEGDDCLIGNAGSDTIYGNAGADTLRGGTGTDDLDPGTGPGDLIDNSDLTGGINRVISRNNPYYTGTGYGDTMVGGADTAGGTANFTLLGDLGNDCLTGNILNDLLLGGDGDDTLRGSVGNDTLDGGLGNDLMDGGDGSADLADYASRSVGINVTFATDVESTLIIDPATGEIDRIINVENVTGGSGNDTISAAGDTVAHVLRGGAGDDYLTGGSGDDTLDAGAGSDCLMGGAGNDLLIAGAANQTLDGGDGTDVVDLSGFNAVSMVLDGNGSDLSVGLSDGGWLKLVNIENIIAGAGADTLVGNSSANLILGNAGDDSIFGNDRADTLLGGTGNDTVYGGAGNDSIDGGASGNDFVSYGTQNVGISAVFDASGSLTIVTDATNTDLAVNVENLAGSTGADTITALGSAARVLSGLDGNDSISGSSGADTLLGGAGRDTLVGGLGNDRLDGGDGLDDAVSYETLTSGISVAFNLGSALISVSLTETDQLINIENVYGGSGADTLSGAGDSVAHLLSGGAGNDLLLGGLAADTLLGGAGNDTVLASFGDDSLDGGAGTDVISYAGLSATQSVSMSFDGTSTILATLFEDGVSVALARLVNFEVFTGSGANDTLVGDNAANTLDGGTGDDSLVGFGGNDTIIGGLGNDTLRGGLGNDSLDGGAGGMDFVSFEDSTAAVSLVLGVSAGLSTATITGGELERLINIENILGSIFNDTLAASTADTTAHMFLGGAGNDSLFGGAAADTLDGGDGNDTLSGGGGNNLLLGGLGNDSILGGTVADTVDGGDGQDTIAGGGGLDSLSGGAGNDSLTGGSSADTITGGDGDDTIVTGGGSDSISGDAGNDSLFGAATSSETITGGDGNDSINGGGGTSADSLVGGLGDDRILGGTGNDSLEGGLGNDVLDGGAGTGDVANYSYTGAPTILIGSGQSVAGGFNTFFISGGGEVDTLINIETLRLGTSGTTIDLSALASGSFGLRVDGSLGTGNHSMVGSAGADSLLGGAGADTFIASLGNDTLDGGAGNDRVDYAYLTAANATFTLSRGNDTVWFGTAAVGSDVDRLQNIEVLRLGSGVNSVLLGGQISTTDLFIDGAQGAANFIATGAGNDVILGGAGNDTLSGGSGNDVIDGGSNNAAGVVDVASYAYTATGLSLTLNGGAALTVSVGLTDVDVLTNIEGLIGGSGSDSLTGDTLANFLSGGSGNDTLVGDAGNDTLDGGSGTDTLDYSYLAPGGSVVITATNDTSFGASVSLTDQDTLFNFERLLGSSGNDRFDFTNRSNAVTLSGLDGNDTLIGGNSGDALLGGAGNDLLQGRAGNDTIDGGTGSDIVSYAYVTPTQTLSITRTNDTTWTGNNSITGNTLELDTLFNIETIILGTGVNNVSLGSQTTSVTIDGLLGSSNLIVTGSGADCLMGGVGSDTISGGAGNDTLISGGGGNDSLVGGAGVDTFIVNGGTVTIGDLGVGGEADVLVVSSGSVIATLGGIWTATNASSNSGSVTINANAFNTDLSLVTLGTSGWTLRNTNAAGVVSATGVYLKGSSLADSIVGGTGADTVFGGLGRDTLDGGAGIDILDYGYATGGISLSISDISSSVGLSYAVGGSLTDIDVIRNFEGIIAGSGDDCLIGDANANTLSGGAGKDTLDGGGGNDIVDYSYVTADISLSVSDAASTAGYSFSVGGSATDVDVLKNFEGFLSGSGNDTLTGDAKDNVLGGGAGNDLFVGGLGNDAIDGGAGTDTADYSTRATDISVSLFGAVASTARVVSNTELDTLTNIENVTTGSGNDSLFGDQLANIFVTGAGNDTVDGGGGNDSVNGGDGNDVLHGGSSYITRPFVNMEEDLGSRWRAISILNTQIAPDGSLTADIMTGQPSAYSGAPTPYDFADPRTKTLSTFTGVPVTYYVKSFDTQPHTAAGFENTINVDTNGVVTAATSGTTVTAVGNGWYRVVIASALSYNVTGEYDTRNVGLSFWGVQMDQTGAALPYGGGDDTLDGGAGNDALTGGGGADLFLVNAGNDTITDLGRGRYDFNTPGGYVAQDILQVGAGATANATLDRNWTATAASSNAGTALINANGLNADLSAITTGNGWTIRNTNAAGTALSTAVSLIGSGLADTIIGGTGSDTLRGGAGNDSISGGTAGVDVVDYGSIGTGLSLTLNSGQAITVTVATDDVDVLVNIEGVLGGAGNDTLTGDANANYFMGRAGDDLIDGKGGFDIVDYSYVADPGTGLSVTLNANGTVIVALTVGGVLETDTLINIEGIIGTGRDDMLTGDSLANLLSGGGGNDQLDGGAGNDTLSGGAGNDIFDGGDGNDIADYSAYAGAPYLNGTLIGLSVALNGSSAVTARLGLSTLLSSYQQDSLVNIENIVGTGFDDTISGDSMANALSGGAGNDLLWGATGNDTLDGGTGTDTVDYSTLLSSVSVTLNGATTVTVSVVAGADIDRLVNIENVLGGAGNDTLTGDSNANILAGGLGNDVLDGGTGNDTLIGGAGDDTYYVNVSTDVITENANEGADAVVSTATAYTLSGNLENLTYNGTGNFNGVGNAVDNVLTGSSGNDTLNGSSGADTLVGGAGNDLYIVDNVSDVLTEQANGGTDTLRTSLTSVSLAPYANVENLSFDLAASGATGTGSSGDNVINGSAYSDSLLGDAGNDTISGFTSTAGSVFTTDVSWTAGNLTRVDNTTETKAPDGSFTAEKFTSTGNNYGVTTGLPSSANSTYSAYVKMALGAAGTTISFSSFTATLSGIGTIVCNNNNGYSISNVAIIQLDDGWYRISLTTVNAGNPFSWAVTTTSPFYMWGVQVDIDSAVARPFGGGNDTLDGGVGTGDVLDYSRAMTDINLSVADISTASPFAYQVMGTASSNIKKIDRLSNFEGILGGSGNDLLTGDGNANYLGGNAGNDSLLGGNGNDTISGGTGNDSLDGGTGTGDVLDYSYATGAITLTVATAMSGNYSVSGSTTDVDTLANFEGIIGGAGADLLTGDANANYLGGNAGNDTLLGGDGNDTLSGGTGNDSLDGGAGTGDVLDYSYATANITLGVSSINSNAAFGYTVVTSSDVDTLKNFEGIIGGSGADSLTGDANDNYLGGNAGADTLLGGLGDDTLSGGAGNDRLDGGDGAGDLADYSYATSGVTVTLDASGNAQVTVSATDVDTLFNVEGVIGGSGNDALSGNASANFLSGGLGDDTLFGGGAGNDTLFGGAGNDLFQFNRTDFTGLQIDGGAGTDTLQFLSSGTFTGASLSAAITGVEVLDFTKSGVAVTANLTDDDLKALGLSALNRDLTIRTDGNDVITIGGSAVTPGDYFVNPGDAGASIQLHVMSSAPT